MLKKANELWDEFTTGKSYRSRVAEAAEKEIPVKSPDQKNAASRWK